MLQLEPWLTLAMLLTSPSLATLQKDIDLTIAAVRAYTRCNSSCVWDQGKLGSIQSLKSQAKRGKLAISSARVCHRSGVMFEVMTTSLIFVGHHHTVYAATIQSKSIFRHKKELVLRVNHDSKMDTMGDMVLQETVSRAKAAPELFGVGSCFSKNGETSHQVQVLERLVGGNGSSQSHSMREACESTFDPSTCAFELTLSALELFRVMFEDIGLVMTKHHWIHETCSYDQDPAKNSPCGFGVFEEKDFAFQICRNRKDSLDIPCRNRYMNIDPEVTLPKSQWFTYAKSLDALGVELKTSPLRPRNSTYFFHGCLFDMPCSVTHYMVSSLNTLTGGAMTPLLDLVVARHNKMLALVDDVNLPMIKRHSDKYFQSKEFASLQDARKEVTFSSLYEALQALMRAT